MSYRPITPEQAREYPYRTMIEYVCENCGEGFSSIKPDPTFCSHECYLEATKPELAARAKKLWTDQHFVGRIQSARRDAGYPDKNRPEAVARRKLRTVAKNAIRRCVSRGSSKTTTTQLSLGYTAEQLRQHIESLFQPGMTWANYGEWEIDHRRPIADFPIDAPLCQINAIENLQPLWKADNRRKHARV